MRLKDQRVYVTGATGFIGGALVRRLVKEGAHVTALTRRLDRAGDLQDLGVELHQGNVTDAATVRIPQGTDLVVHGAAWVGFGIPRGRHELYWRTNVEGTRTVLDAARRADVPRAVHLSSVAAIGRTPADRDATEDDFRFGTPGDDAPFEVAGADTGESRGARAYRSLYEETKAAAHQAGLDAGIPVVMPMPGVVLGPGGPFEPLQRAFARERLRFLPRDDAPTPWVHVDDVVEGVLRGALKGEGPYVLVSENLAVSELFARLRHRVDARAPRLRVPLPALKGGATAIEKAYHAVGRTPPVSRELVESLEAPMRFSSDRARRELGWEDDFWGRVTTDTLTLKKRRRRHK